MLVRSKDDNNEADGMDDNDDEDDGKDDVHVKEDDVVNNKDGVNVKDDDEGEEEDDDDVTARLTGRSPLLRVPPAASGSGGVHEAGHGPGDGPGRQGLQAQQAPVP